MKGKILVTDSLFIALEHEVLIRNAGYEIERIDKSKPTEEELIAAIKGKVGYILGGIEQVTQNIIDAGSELKVISFPGIGYKDFIPAWEYATKKGIPITNAPDGPTHAVAEWAITMALSMNRSIFELGKIGEKDFKTTNGIEGQHIGIVGFGRIGSHIAEMIKPFRPASISYFSKHKHEDSGLAYKELTNLLSQSDIIFLCLPNEAGNNFIGEDELVSVKNGALLVTFMHQGILNEEVLLKELQSGRIRAVSDYPAKDEAFKELPLSVWYSFNGSNAFNTTSGIKKMSDETTESLLNILETGEDKNKVN